MKWTASTFKTANSNMFTNVKGNMDIRDKQIGDLSREMKTIKKEK